MNCAFEAGACRRCGARRDPPYPLRRCTPGIGDAAAIALKAVGITESRAERLARLAGYASCGCPGRRAYLNRVGRYFGIGDSTAETGLTAIPDKAEPKK
jgi:hypothetical protein